MNVPVSKPDIGEKEKQYVLDALEKGAISGSFGEYIDKFEKGFAEFCGAEYGIAVSNGTTALHLAVATLRIGAGDEVLASTFTNMASFFAVLYTGATPVPIDIEEDTWNLNPALLESRITPRTKAIMVVHVFGHPVDMDPVLEIARKHNLLVIEDAAEAHGAEYKGKRVGVLGDIGCFSFYANKIITTGEGGMLVTNNKAYAARARELRSLAYGKENKFIHAEVGFNYRMPNLQAALGVAQLQKIENAILRKREIAQFYTDNLREVQNLRLPVEKSYAKNVYWVYNVVLGGDLKGKRSEVMLKLKEKGIETREAFAPYNLQPENITHGLVKAEDCPVANDVAANGFYLPSGPVISKEEQEYVIASLKEVLASQ